MGMPDINWLAVALCAMSSLFLGGVWYSPLLFGKTWQTAVGLSEAELQRNLRPDEIAYRDGTPVDRNVD